MDAGTVSAAVNGICVATVIPVVGRKLVTTLVDWLYCEPSTVKSVRVLFVLNANVGVVDVAAT